MAQVLKSLKSDIVQSRRHNSASLPFTRQSISRVGQSLDSAAGGGTPPATDPKFSKITAGNVASHQDSSEIPTETRHTCLHRENVIFFKNSLFMH